MDGNQVILNRRPYRTTRITITVHTLRLGVNNKARRFPSGSNLRDQKRKTQCSHTTVGRRNKAGGQRIKGDKKYIGVTSNESTGNRHNA